MEPGIMLYIDCKVDIYEQIKVLKEIGVRRTFINAKYPDIDKALNAIKEAGIICDNLHGEYTIKHQGKAYNMGDISKEGIGGDLLTERILENIDACARNQIPLIVVHPPQEAPELAINDYTKKRYTKIGDYAREKGVTVAFENIAYTKNLEYVMSLVPDAKFCWDCGHEGSRLIGEKPMNLFSQKLAALHVHDNFLKLGEDKHMIPFTGKIDYENVGRQLAESGYDGTLMLEILYGKNEESSTEPTYKDFALKAKSAAERVIEIVEKHRNSNGVE